MLEDDDIIAVFKPAKLPCGRSREQRHFYLWRFVEHHVGRPVHMPSRLDTSAQGLVLFSKSKRMHRPMQQAFEKHAVEKYYLLHVSPAVGWQGKLVDGAIGKDPKHPILRAVVQSGGCPRRPIFEQSRRFRNLAGALAHCCSQSRNPGGHISCGCIPHQSATRSSATIFTAGSLRLSCGFWPCDSRSSIRSRRNSSASRYRGSSCHLGCRKERSAILRMAESAVAARACEITLRISVVVTHARTLCEFHLLMLFFS